MHSAMARTGTNGASSSQSALILGSVDRPRVGTTRFHSTARDTAESDVWLACCHSEPSSRSISPTSTVNASPRAKRSNLASRVVHGSRQALPSVASIRSDSCGPQLPAAYPGSDWSPAAVCSAQRW